MRPRRNARSPHTRYWLALLVGALIAAGCGGGDSDDDTAGAVDPGSDATSDDTGSADESSDDSSSADTDSADTDSADTGSDDTGSSDTGSSDTAPAGSATVTIDGETFVGTQEVVCLTFGGAVGGSWFDETGEISISIDLPPPDWEDSPDDWEAPSVRVDDDTDQSAIRQFQASTELAATLNLPGAEAAAVTSYSIDGSSASGTAVFIEFFGSMAAVSSGDDPPGPVEGTFTLTCG